MPMIGTKLAHDRITSKRWRGMGGTLLVLCGAVVLPAPDARADQIVLRDGQTIDTRGAVRLDSRQAIYTDLSGRLVSLRIAEVDVARTLTPPEKPAAVPLEASSTPKSPLLRLTDADVGHVVDAATNPAATTGSDKPAAPVVTLYSTSWCGWCRKSRALMQTLGIAFVEKDVERDPRAAAEKARLAGAQSGVPVLVRSGAVVRGYDEATIRSWAPDQKPGKS